MQSSVDSAAGPSNPRQASENDYDTEWEYEYDAEETEDFYVTLDLTTFAAPAKPKRKTAASKGSNAAKSRKAQDEDPGEEDEDLNADEDAGDDDANAAEQPTEPPTPAPHEDEPGPSTSKQGDNIEASPPEAAAKISPDRIQVLELHSKHPVISYGGRFYRCSWAEALGTDLIFEPKPGSKPAPASAQMTEDPIRSVTVGDNDPETTRKAEALPSLRPLASHRGFNTIAASKLRLIAKPVKLTPRVPPIAAPSNNNVAGVAQVPDTPTGSGGITPSVYMAPSRQAQADFLTRFAAIKAARGETDEVPFASKKGRGPRRGQGRGRGQGRNGGYLINFDDVESPAGNDGQWEGFSSWALERRDGANADTHPDQDVEMNDEG